jgi:hypothetical protein
MLAQQISAETPTILWFHVVLRNSLRHIAEECLKFGHSHYHLRPFKFIINQSPYHFDVTDSIVK